MSDKPVIRSQLATRDAEAIAHYYRSAAADEQALQFADALEESFSSIGQFPRAGSPRLSQVLKIPDLRSWPVRGFPYLVF